MVSLHEVLFADSLQPPYCGVQYEATRDIPSTQLPATFDVPRARINVFHLVAGSANLLGEMRSGVSAALFGQ